MKNLLKAEERIDDLQYKGFKIIQNPNEFCFGIDAILLSNFVNVKNKDEVLDLGTGTGIIPILIAAKTKVNHITGIEIQPYLSDMANRSIKLNSVEDKITIINDDLNNILNYLNPSTFDIITCNPPYKKKHTGIKNPESSRAIARHEIKCTLQDIIKVSSKLLKVKGKLCLIHRPERLADILCSMREFNIEPKRARFIYSKVNKPPTMVLVEGVRNSGQDFRIFEPLIIYSENGEYTQEVHDIYYGEI